MSGKNNLDSMPQIVIKYIRYITVIKNLSKLTADEYIFDLRIFFKFLKYICDNNRQVVNYKSIEIDDVDISDINMDFIKDITKEDIYSYLYFMIENRDNINRSRARKLSTIKGFFKYLTVKENILSVNPTEGIDSPTIKQALPKFLSLEECQTLLDTIKNDEKNVNRTRDYCILTLFLNCGMRLAELCGINITDFSPDFRTLRILGKRNKERFIYLNDACHQTLMEFLEFQKKIDLTIDNLKPLFITRQNNRISRSSVQKMVNRCFNAAGLAEKNYSVHKLRHTAATLLYQYGEVDTKVLQEILGHENLNTTQIYTHVANRQIVEAMQKNPLSGEKTIKRTGNGKNESDEI